MNDSTIPPKFERRLDDLESALAHQQHAFDGLNQVVIEQMKTIEGLQRRLQKIESDLENVQQQVPGESRDLLSEKPPHY